MFAVGVRKLIKSLIFLFILIIKFKERQCAVVFQVVSRNVTAPERWIIDEKNRRNMSKVYDVEPLLMQVRRDSDTVQSADSSDENNFGEVFDSIRSADFHKANNHRKDLEVQSVENPHVFTAHRLEDLLQSIQTFDPNEAQNLQQDLQSVLRTHNRTDFIQSATSYVAENLTEFLETNDTSDLYNDLYNARNLPEELQSINPDSYEAQNFERDLQSVIRTQNLTDFIQSATSYVADNLTEFLKPNDTSDLYNDLYNARNLQEQLQSVNPGSYEAQSLRQEKKHSLQPGQTVHFNDANDLGDVYNFLQTADSYEDWPLKVLTDLNEANNLGKLLESTHTTDSNDELRLLEVLQSIQRSYSDKNLNHKEELQFHQPSDFYKTHNVEENPYLYESSEENTSRLQDLEDVYAHVINKIVSDGHKYERHKNDQSWREKSLDKDILKTLFQKVLKVKQTNTSQN
ncbi:hypothetical protein O0L34_g248 [Tuta absoluta]|nr:hypothetical protein O0L34_g248 [Tuta absoluta]